MPINADQEYFVAQRRYYDAKTIDEKIIALEEVLRCAPKHKGAHNLLAQLRLQLSKLKKERQKQKKSARRTFGIEKEGAGQVCLLGFANSGKSQLLKALTGVGEPSEHSFSTVKPVVGMMKFEDVWIQLVEIPSNFEPRFLSVASTSDINIFLVDMSKENQLSHAKDFIDKNHIRKYVIVGNKKDLSQPNSLSDYSLKISAKTGEELDQLRKYIWESLHLIRVYTKGFGKSAEKKPITFREGATIGDVAKNVHKDMLKFFKFARVWGSTKFPGSKVGLEYKLKDKDIVEIRMKQ